MGKPVQKATKATFSLDGELVTRINACASLRGLSRDAFATAAFEEACKGLVLFDRGRKFDRSAGKDRVVPEDGVSPTGENEAA